MILLLIINCVTNFVNLFIYKSTQVIDFYTKIKYKEKLEWKEGKYFSDTNKRQPEANSPQFDVAKFVLSTKARNGARRALRYPSRLEAPALDAGPRCWSHATIRRAIKPECSPPLFYCGRSLHCGGQPRGPHY